MPPANAPTPEALALLDEAPCGLLQTSGDGTILRVNRTFCGWVGFAAEELIGHRRFQDLLTMGGRIFHQTHWFPLLRMQGSVSEVKLEVLHREGAILPMVLNALRHDRPDAVVHDLALFVARDRDKYEKELLASRTRLQELVTEATRLQAEAKDRALFAEQMVGIVSHDLRNPLSSISMGAALLGRAEMSAGQERTVARIARSAQRASWLIGDLLDFTQARLGNGLSVAMAPMDLHALVSESVEELATIYPDRTLEHCTVGAGACTGDANRLTQLVGNLVSNAMTYGSHDAPVIVRSSIDAQTFEISVMNQGEPIPATVRERLFQPMTRGSGATSGGRSVGLGLFIVREIAKAHRGTVSVDSSAERGTIFTASFPRGD